MNTEAKRTSALVEPVLAAFVLDYAYRHRLNTARCMLSKPYLELYSS